MEGLFSDSEDWIFSHLPKIKKRFLRSLVPQLELHCVTVYG